MSSRVKIRELAAWDLDLYPWRDHMFGQRELEQRTSNAVRSIAPPISAGDSFDSSALLVAETQRQQQILEPQRQRPELQAELRGLDWTLGVVDLSRLIAFQRRLVLDPDLLPLPVPQPDDWQGLCDLAFNGRRNLSHRVQRARSDANGYEVHFHSSNPDLRITLAEPFTGDSLPLMLTGGSPLFEVAEFRGRWFLRDGYHRAFRMLQAGVKLGFAAIVRARTLEELGAVEPFFFGEKILFSARPPKVIDFLEDNLILTYERPRMRKTISLRIHESLEPVTDCVTE